MAKSSSVLLSNWVKLTLCVYFLLLCEIYASISSITCEVSPVANCHYNVLFYSMISTCDHPWIWKKKECLYKKNQKHFAIQSIYVYKPCQEGNVDCCEEDILIEESAKAKYIIKLYFLKLGHRTKTKDISKKFTPSFYLLSLIKESFFHILHFHILMANIYGTF